ncbi:hypothetical protein [Luteolibacter sp. LG18]|uniref:hypothetical protein n=1 Tax=Luteolibacter sp. LG18 TaxID=2819286 RepID=UPI002B299D6C|nr:hypothetical protein llg_03590 [Luteolibacter sp. LG18]
MRVLLTAALCAIAALLTSCFDAKEELWLTKEGAATFEATYDVPTTTVRLGGGETKIRGSVDDWLKESPEVRCETLEITQHDDRTTIHIRVSCASVLKIVDLSKPEKSKGMPAPFQHLAGVVEVKRDGLDVELTRTISPNRALIGGLFLPRKEIDGRRLVYVMHLPEVPLESNATRTEDGGKTLVWDYTLAEGLKRPLVTRLKGRVPLPWWVWGGGSVVGLGLVWAGYKLTRRLRRK